MNFFLDQMKFKKININMTEKEKKLDEKLMLIKDLKGESSNELDSNEAELLPIEIIDKKNKLDIFDQEQESENKSEKIV